jgi:hypothetical protein
MRLIESTAARAKSAADADSDVVGRLEHRFGGD